MRRQIAQALAASKSSPLRGRTPALEIVPVLARRPFPNFATYIDSDWSGNSSYNSFNAKLEHRTRFIDLHRGLHVGEEHRQQVRRRRHRQRRRRLAGIPG